MKKSEKLNIKKNQINENVKIKMKVWKIEDKEAKVWEIIKINRQLIESYLTENVDNQLVQFIESKICLWILHMEWGDYSD
jgi:hypothetical protein